MSKPLPVNASAAIEKIRHFRFARRPGVQNSQFSQLPANIGTVIASKLNPKNLQRLLLTTRKPMEVTRHLHENNEKRKRRQQELLKPMSKFARNVGKSSLTLRRFYAAHELNHRSNNNNPNNNNRSNNNNPNNNNRSNGYYKKHVQKLHNTSSRTKRMVEKGSFYKKNTQNRYFENENPYWEYLKLIRIMKPVLVPVPKTVKEPLTQKNILLLRNSLLRTMKRGELSGNMRDPEYTEPFFTTLNHQSGNRVVKNTFLTTKNGKTSISLVPTENGNKMFIKKIQSNGSKVVYSIFPNNMYNPFNNSIKPALKYFAVEKPKPKRSKKSKPPPGPSTRR
jgi:hypothetical protein